MVSSCSWRKVFDPFSFHIDGFLYSTLKEAIYVKFEDASLNSGGGQRCNLPSMNIYTQEVSPPFTT